MNVYAKYFDENSKYMNYLVKNEKNTEKRFKNMEQNQKFDY